MSAVAGIGAALKGGGVLLGKFLDLANSPGGQALAEKLLVEHGHTIEELDKINAEREKPPDPTDPKE